MVNSKFDIGSLVQFQAKNYYGEPEEALGTVVHVWYDEYAEEWAYSVRRQYSLGGTSVYYESELEEYP